jgi:predicted CXXCH cytochrome family protein
MRICVLAMLLPLWLAAEDTGKIMRPTEGAAIASAEVDVIATARGGKLQIDGKAIDAESPFPDVLHATVRPGAGAHTLTLSWEGGSQSLQFFSGANAPAGFAAYHQHPPLADVKCTQCHEVNRRGRFRFKGGCFDCHQETSFAKVHTHDTARLEQCGLCHNAHGSTVKAHLLYSKETACKICHN